MNFCWKEKDDYIIEKFVVEMAKTKYCYFTYWLSGNYYRVGKLKVVIGIIMPSLKLIGQF